MKPLNQLRDELAEIFGDRNTEYGAESGFKAGFNAATDLVFDRIVEALKAGPAPIVNNEMQAWAWLTENKERILK